MNLSIDLTDEQTIGLKYATQQHNASLPEGDTALTVEEYTSLVVTQIADHRWSEADKEQAKLFKEKLDTLTEAERKALRAQVGVEDIIKPDTVKAK